MTAHGASAASRGLMACHACALVARAVPQAVCSRCGAHLHFRKPESMSRAWAYLVAAIVLYVPANTLPITETSSLFGSQADTIMSGVVYLWTSGSQPIAFVVFFASVMVPMLKIIAIMLLLVTVGRRSRWQPGQRMRLYRLVEFVGRWSMLDIYVVAVLATLVQLQGLASIKAGPAAIAFGAVVVLSMLSAMAFDPRLIWDPLEPIDERRATHR